LEYFAGVVLDLICGFGYHSPGYNLYRVTVHRGLVTGRPITGEYFNREDILFIRRQNLSPDE